MATIIAMAQNMVMDGLYRIVNVISLICYYVHWCMLHMTASCSIRETDMKPIRVSAASIYLNGNKCGHVQFEVYQLGR